ncbi:MAG TPA: TIGR02680 family protein, partial [Thermoanaerobaculia bacterium]|nr:TIGR02680 family protein [Thermoanaerobaculia bacterium]
MSDALFGRRQLPPRLPAPRASRFTPLRAGIVNIWQYDEQELRFEQGRLLLRGDNGTGKSKALELLLPFLFDADLSPQRLDPFAGNARTMYWNLLQGDRFDNRVGYVWLELGRRLEDDEGEGEEIWTIGCGLRATRRTQRVDSWYFITRRRIGADLSLLSPQRVPLLKDELRKAIGEEGDLYETGREYRERLDHLFFHLGTERFAALRHLLLQLRRPQLSQKLDPQSLGELLTESLPPLDADLIGQLSETFERLDQDQRELARVESAAREVEAFLGVYRDYARGAARGRAAAVRQADSRYHKTAAEAREAEAERERLAVEEGELAERRREVEGAAATAGAELRALEASEAMRSAEVLRARRERADDLAHHAAAALADCEEAERGEAAARGEDARAAAEAREAEEERQGQDRVAAATAEEGGLAAAHAAAVESLAESPSQAEATARAAIERGRRGVAELRDLAAGRDRAREGSERAEDRQAGADARWQQAAARTAAARRDAERATGELEGTLTAWRGDLRELALDEASFAALREAALAATATAGALLARLAEPQADGRLREIRDAEREAGRLAEERRETAEERERVAAARDLGPAAPRTREAADRPIRPGAPLYLLCDFAESLEEAERAGLEAALEAAGLLDAWVTPGGELLAPGTLDTVLLPTSRDRPGTLADLLVPTPAHGVEGEVIAAVLRSLDLDGSDRESASPWVSRDGSWRLGPLQGAWRKPTAEHVGATAREAARRRRLAELTARLAELDSEIAAAAARRAALLARLERLRQEIAALP